MEDLCQALVGITDSSDVARKKSEAYISSLPEAQLSSNLLQCLEHVGANQTVVRSISAVLLRKKLADGDCPFFGRLPPDAQSAIKSKLLQALKTESDKTVRSKICDTIVEIAALIFNKMQDRWDDWLQFLFHSVAQEDIMQETILWALGRMCEECPSVMAIHMPMITQALASILDSGSVDSKVAAFKTACQIIESSSEDQIDSLKPFCFKFLSLLEFLIVHQHESFSEECLQSLVSVAEMHGELFSDTTGQFLKAMSQLCKCIELSEGIRRQAMEFIAAIMECFSDKFSEEIDSLKEACILSLTMMSSLEEDATWASKTSNYDSSEDAIVETGQICISRIGCAIGEKFLAPFSTVLSQFAANAEWQARHSALLAIVQCAELMERPQVNQVLSFVLISLKDVHPRVRWAAAQAISQLLTEHAEWMADEHHFSLLPTLLNVVRDPVPRVVVWGCSALRDLCEHLDKEITTKHLDKVLGECLRLLHSGLPFVQERSAQVIAWVSDAVEDGFAPFYPSFEEPLFNLIQHSSCELLRGRALEALTSAGRAVGADLFSTAARRLMDITISVVKNSPEGVLPPNWPAYYVLHAWKRTASVIKEDFACYLPHIMQTMLGCATQEAVEMPEGEDTIVVEVDGRQRCVSTSTIEEKTAACIVIGEISAEHAPKGFKQYIQVTLGAMVSLTTFTLDTGVQEAAIECLVSLARCMIEDLSPDQYSQAATAEVAIIEGIWLAESSKNVELTSTVVRAVRDVAHHCKVLSLPFDASAKIFTRLFDLVCENSQRQAYAVTQEKNQDIDEDELKDKEDWEQILMEVIIDAFGAFMKTPSSGVAVSFLNSKVPVLISMLGEESTMNQKMACVGIVGQVIMNAPAEVVAAYVQQFIPEIFKLLTFPATPTIELKRQGLIALQAAVRHDAGNLEKQILILAQMCSALLQTKYDEEEDEEKEESLRDVAAGTLASIFALPSHGGLDLTHFFPVWLRWLPIKQDGEQVELCYRTLSSLVMANIPAVIGPNMINMPLVARVLGDIDSEDAELEEETSKMLQVMAQQMSANPEVRKMCTKMLDAAQKQNFKNWSRQK